MSYFLRIMIPNPSRRGVSLFILFALVSAFPSSSRAITTEQYAQLAELAYYPSGDPNMSNALTPAGFTRLLVSNGSSSGFGAEAFQETATQAIVVSYRGTNSIEDALADLGIGTDDIGSAERAAANQAEGALEKLDPKATAFINKAPSIVLKPNAVLLTQLKQAGQFFATIAAKYPGKTITITGHSLGGYLGQIVASNTGSYAVLFNAPGAVDMTHGANKNMMNYIRQHDVVGTLGTHLGALALYPDVKIDLKSADPYVLRNHSIVNIREDLAAGMTTINGTGLIAEVTLGLDKVLDAAVKITADKNVTVDAEADAKAVAGGISTAGSDVSHAASDVKSAAKKLWDDL